MTKLPAPPPLDMRNVMWLLAAMAFVVAPHLGRLPYWVGIFFVVVVAWRAWIAWAALRLAPRFLVLLITAAAAVGTFLQYQRITGREPGVTLLVVMASLKLLEMRTQREVVLSIYLGFFLVMTNFLFSQSIPLGLYMLVCVWLFIATLVGFNRIGSTPTLLERLRPAGALLLQALPLMAAFFILFPRVQGPLWALPQDARGGTSGLSEEMTPGNIASLIKSDAIAFRVRFHGERPPFPLLYWRGPVMNDFDGRTWRMQGAMMAQREGGGTNGPIVYASTGDPVSYDITLEPHNKNWLFALDVPAAAPKGAYPLMDLQLRSYRPVDQRLHYVMTSYLRYRYEEGGTPLLLRFNRRLDETRNPRTVELGRKWAREFQDPRRIVQEAVLLYNRQFTYTLEPPPLDPANPYDDFLFRTKRGFCEHYAGSFALLMRAAGIPARVVTGYQGGEVNPLNGEVIVRQADAHAWTEIWLDGQGWTRVDPTAVVSPLRVENGVNAALGPIGVIPSMIAADKFGILASVRYSWQYLNSQWDQWIVGYNVDKQRQFFSDMGLHEVDWRTLAFWLMVAILVVGGGVTLGLLYRERPARTEASLAAWNRFCAKLAGAGLPRRPSEGPLDYLDRVKAARPEWSSDLEAITLRYIAARYGTGATRDDLRDLAARVRDFRAA
jgi:transglutaminase-like putative cysteine protease